MRNFLLALLLAASPALATERQLMNPETNGDLVLKANVAGTPTTALTVAGATGNVAVAGGFTTTGAFLSSQTADYSPAFKTTGTANALALFLQSGNGTSSGRFAYTANQTLETSPQRWDSGLFGTKDWVVHDNTNSRTPLTIAATDGIATFSSAITASGGITGTTAGTNGAAGIVGQDLSIYDGTGFTGATSAQWSNLATQTLTAGEYETQACVSFVTTAASTTVDNWGVAMSTATGNTTTGQTEGVTQLQWGNGTLSGGGNGSVLCSPWVLVRVFGGNITFPANGTSTAGGALFAKVFPGTYTGTLTIKYSWRVKRTR